MTDLSPSLLARAFDAHPGAQLLVAVDTGRVRGANRAAATLVGCSPARMTGRPLDEIVPAGDTRGAGSLLARLQPENGASPGPALVVEVSGRPLELGAVPVGDDDGTPLLLVTLQDVTERVHTERRLRDYHEILEDVPVPFYRASPGEDSHFLRVNPALVDLFDADSPEELHAHPITDLYADPADRDEFLETLARDGRVFRCELRMRTLRGRTIWTADSAFRHLDEEGRPVIDGILEDKANMSQQDNFHAIFFQGHAVNSQTRGPEMKEALEAVGDQDLAGFGARAADPRALAQRRLDLAQLDAVALDEQAHPLAPRRRQAQDPGSDAAAGGVR